MGTLTRCRFFASMAMWPTGSAPFGPVTATEDFPGTIFSEKVSRRTLGALTAAPPRGSDFTSRAWALAPEAALVSTRAAAARTMVFCMANPQDGRAGPRLESAED